MKTLSGVVCLVGALFLASSCSDSGTPPPKDQRVADHSPVDVAPPDQPIADAGLDLAGDQTLEDIPDGPPLDAPPDIGTQDQPIPTDLPPSDQPLTPDILVVADACIGLGCSCTSHAQCSAGGAQAICVGGQCVAGCNASVPCATSGQKCCNSTCVTGTCCTSSDCPGGQVCNANHTCGSCTTTSECPSGAVCCDISGQKSCVVGNCCGSADCSGGQGCVANECRDLCGATVPCKTGYQCCANACYQGNCCSNADCSGGLACIKNACTACTADLQCELGEICDAGKCVTGCNGNVTCLSGSVCCTAAGPQCKPGSTGCKGDCYQGACCNSADCQGGEICTSDHICRVPCSSPSACGAGSHCCSGYCYSTPCVSTLAGSGLMGAANAPIASALINGVFGVADDGKGNALFTEWNGASSAVRLLNNGSTAIGPVAAGSVGRVAGGTWGCRAGPALAAEMRTPIGLARDPQGNTYIADYECTVIWKLSADYSTVTLLAGQRDSHGVVDGTGSAAKFGHPRGITYGVDGYLYVSEWDYHRIRRVSLAGAVTTVAGTGTAGVVDGAALQAQFYHPGGLAMDAGGTLFVGDWSPGTVRKITGLASANPIVSTIVDSTPKYGSAAHATLSVSSGNQVFINFWDNGLYRLSPPVSGTEYNTTQILGGSGIISNAIDPTAKYLWLGGWVHDNGSNSYSNTISKFDIATSNLTPVAGTKGRQGVVDGAGSSATFSLWGGGSIAADASGNIWVAGYYENRVRKVAPSGSVTSYGSGEYGEVAGTATTARMGGYPAAITTVGTNVYYANRYSGRHVMKIDATTGNITVLSQVCVPGQPGCTYPSEWGGMVADSAGNLYFTSNYMSSYGSIGMIVKIPGLGSGTPVFFAGTSTQRGCVDGPLGTGQLMTPYGLAIDTGGYLYVADNGCGVRKIAPDGTISTLTTQFKPVGIAISPPIAGVQTLYANNGNTIWTVDRLTGAAAYFAGDSNITFDDHYANGVLTKAKFWNPYSMATNSQGDLHVMDAYNNRIRVVYP